MSEKSTMEEFEEKAIEKGKVVKKRRTSALPRHIHGGQTTHLRSIPIKLIMRSVTKPLYNLGTLGLRNVRVENRRKLRYFLRKLLRQQNWKEASGVLSVLLQGTGKERCQLKNRTKFVATMELLKHIKNASRKNPTKMQHVYEIWMRRIMWKNQTLKDRFMVRLEFILFCLTHGINEDAHQAVMCLIQDCDFGKDPTSNMIVGMTFYQLWYSSIPEEMQVRDVDVLGTPSQSETSRTRSNNIVQHPVGQAAANNHEAVSSFEKVYIGEADSRIKRDSCTSVRIGKDIALDQSFPQGLYENSVKDSGHERSSDSNCGDNRHHASIFNARGLDPWLLPLRMPHTDMDWEDFNHFHGELLNDFYNNGVKYLRLALSSTPPLLEALHPLVQMLLLGDRVKEALTELEKFSGISGGTVALRLKARILDQFNKSNCRKLSPCLEDILKKDPTCSQSLARLIDMHHNGEYSSEELVEMIALHLDATYAEWNIWKEFASCFLNLSKCEEDRISMCIDGNEGGGDERKLGFCVPYNRVPKIFADNVSAKSWKFRCKWWLTRHFSLNIIKSDIAAVLLVTTTGDLQLLAYKAASASHLYGSGFEYVVKAYTVLEKKDRDLFSFLQRHLRNSTGFYSNGSIIKL